MNTNAVIIEPSEFATASVIWLHGLGADGHDFEPIVSQFPKTFTRYTRFIFPHAPPRPITINGGMVMRGWYDIFPMPPTVLEKIQEAGRLDLDIQQDAQGIHDSDQILRNYIAQELEQGISAQRIVLAGFSQGGAIALHTGLRYPLALAGIMALSTYLPLADTVEDEIHVANRHTSIFMGHGQFDQVILFPFAERSRAYLAEKLGYNIEWHTYNMQHSVNAEEIVDIAHWLSARLP